jgi:hypothetical protein
MSMKKYELIKRVSIPLISLAMLFSTLASRLTVQDLYANEYVTMDTTQVIPPASEDDELDPAGTALLMALANTTPQTTQAQTTQPASTPLAQVTSFSELRSALENLFGVRSFGGTKEGPLYTVQGGDLYGTGSMNKTTNIDNPTYMNVIGSPLFQPQMNAMRQQVIEIAKLSFPDIVGTEYWAHSVVYGVYYQLINGYPDGTFKGDNPVSRAEAATIVSIAYHGKPTATAYTDGTGTDQLLRDAGCPEWAIPYWCSSNYMPELHKLGGDRTEMYNAGMTRAEVATLLAMTFFSNQARPYRDKALNASNSPFNDITAVLTVEDANNIDMATEESILKYKYEQMAAGVIPQEHFAAILLLNDLGIMNGDDLGRSLWNEPVTRGQLMVMLESTMRVLSEQSGYN